MKKATAVAWVLVIVTWCFASGQVHEADPTEPFRAAEQPFSFWMDAKLDESQKIFAALAQADYAAVIASVDTLKTVNTLEAFVRRKSPGYRKQLGAFEFAVDEMRTQAKAENLEGIVLGFQQMTLSCVNCHKQLREAIPSANGAASGAKSE